MMRNNFGHRTSANDECYTQRQTAEEIINEFGYLMEGKKIILPCDTENSQLYQVLKERGFDCDIAQDMYGINYSKYDLVFTNPPFSCAAKYVYHLMENDIKFILFTPWMLITGIQSGNKWKKYKNDIFRLKVFHAYFDQPNGTTINVQVCLITNLPEGKQYVLNSGNARIEPIEYTYYKGIFSDCLHKNYLKYDYVDLRKSNGSAKMKLREEFINHEN